MAEVYKIESKRYSQKEDATLDEKKCSNGKYKFHSPRFHLVEASKLMEATPSSRSRTRAPKELLRHFHPGSQFLSRQLMVRHIDGPRDGHQLGWPRTNRVRYHPGEHRLPSHCRVPVRAGVRYARCWGSVLLDESTG